MNIIIDSQLIISRRTFNYKPGRQTYVQFTHSLYLVSFFFFLFLWRGKAVSVRGQIFRNFKVGEQTPNGFKRKYLISSCSWSKSSGFGKQIWNSIRESAILDWVRKFLVIKVNKLQKSNFSDRKQRKPCLRHKTTQSCQTHNMKLVVGVHLQ